MTELTNLTYEQNKKYQAAIEAGYFEGFEKDPRQWKHSFLGAFLWKNPGRKSTIDYFKNILGHAPTWDDINEDNLRDFVDYMLERGLSPSSVRTMCAEVKAVLNANKRKFCCEDFASLLSVKGNTSQSVYLTRDEMEAFINEKPLNMRERYVHRVFCVAMLTGARRVDAEKLTMANCDMDTNTISYVPQKTPNIIVTLPVDERMPLRRFLADVAALRHPVNEDTFNEIVRRLCERCGFNSIHTIRKSNRIVTDEKWKLVSSHTARRTFATNLYVAGISIEDIALMMGHGKNIETTKRYLCADRPLTSNVLAYFQPKQTNKA
jgi:site-specific recombinase XerD